MSAPLSGKRLGVYQVHELIGRGGMGEVYRAHDTSLGRSVAIKILPEGVTADADRLARFEREARVLAALQHPNIAIIHGMERADGMPAIVLEFVGGETLAERIARNTGSRGAVAPFADLLAIARQIADALEAAHEKGVVHRDLKPANVKVTPEGLVKVLDFGLAKVADPVGAAEESTLTTIEPTRQGFIAGTLSYMSPEQTRGQSVDKRTDIWAFGCVLFELLSGQRAFGADTPADIVAAILEREPAWDRLPPATPAPIRRLLRRCLEKDPRRRLRDIGDARIDIDEALSPRPSDELAAVRALSIAVKPLANLSGSPANDYFGEGLAEEITSALAKAGLHVIGRTSARALAARGLGPREVARELRVATVLDGSVQRADDRVRISVTLLSGSDGSVMWAERYDRRLEDIFAIQDEIARSVATELRATLKGGSLVRQETTDPQAHSLYLQGLYLWNRRTAPSIRQAVGLFEQALERDPNYARGYAGVALSKSVLPFYEDVNADALAKEARDAARRALAIDPTLTEAWAVQGIVNMCQWQLADAARDFTRAIDADPTFATARFWHGLYLTHLGKFDDADREFTRARDLEPLSLVIRVGQFLLLVNQRRFAEAEVMARGVVADDPSFALARFQLAALLADSGRFEESAAMLSAILDVPSVRPAEVRSTLAYALARAGRLQEARSVIEALRVSRGGQFPPTAVLASALMVLGDREAGIEVLRAAVEQHDPNLALIGHAARLDELRSDPQARAILALAWAH